MKPFLLGLWRRLRGTPGSSVRAGAAVAIGLFIGCQPLYGLHFVLVLAICVPLRLDAVLSYLAANVSNPLFAPFLIFSEVEAGAYLSSGRFVRFDVAQARLTGAAGFARFLFLGGVVVGTSLALLGFALAVLVAARRRSSGAARPALSAFEAAVERTRARYDRAKPADRYYVAGKLAFDPVFKLIAELDGSLGHVLDLGCGRGQLSLLLLELGRASRVLGIDTDARKIAAARSAGPEAEFRVEDVATAVLPRADTVLLIDVLHYLPLVEQDALLRSAARALTPGGRLLVRELDAAVSARTGVTRLFEWFARRTGFNRGRSSAYRPARDLTELLESSGLACRVHGASERTPFANVLIVAGGSPSAKDDAAMSASSTRVSAVNA